MARRIALIVLVALSLRCKHTPMTSSTYESYHPCCGIGMETSASNAGAKGSVDGDIFGDGTLFGLGIYECVVTWFQHGLLVMSLARSVMASMMTHHSAGLYDPPNVNWR